MESAKLRAESANSIGVLVSYVCRAPCAVFAFVVHMPRFLHTLVSCSSCPCASRAPSVFASSVPCVPHTLVRHVPHAAHAECALVLHLPSALGTVVLFMPHLLYLPHVQHTLII